MSQVTLHSSWAFYKDKHTPITECNAIDRQHHPLAGRHPCSKAPGERRTFVRRILGLDAAEETDVETMTTSTDHKATRCRDNTTGY